MRMKLPPPGSTQTWNGRPVANARAWYATTVGITVCARCGLPITGQWHLGHILDRARHPQLVWEPTNWQAEHVRCSTSSGATMGNKMRGQIRAAKKQAGIPLAGPKTARTATRPPPPAPGEGVRSSGAPDAPRRTCRDLSPFRTYPRRVGAGCADPAGD